MKQRRSISLLMLPLALSLGAVSCHAPTPLRQEVVAQVPSITGHVTDLLGRSVQATTADVANGATVSLIDTATGQTVATTVTTPTGGFTLSFGSDFKPVTGKPYYMEAVKGLPVGGSPNRAGAAIARVRTLLFYNWNGWSSLSGGVGFPVSIGKATTTVAAIVGLKGLSAASQSALVGTISGTNFTDPSHTIGSVDYSTVFNLVDAAVSADQDPLEALAFDSSGATPAAQYVLKAGNLVIHDNYSVNGAPSPATASLNAPYNTITFYGQNFPSSASVIIGTVPVSTWSVNATRTQLTATLASNGYSGALQISRDTSTWTGPFVPVSGTVGTYIGTVALPGFKDGKLTEALINAPGQMKMDANGNIYLADDYNRAIRKISPDGMVTTLAGNGISGYAEGIGTTAQFRYPWGIGVGADGTVYVPDNSDNRIRKITSDGVTSTLAGSGVAGYADGTGTAAQFNSPLDAVVDSSGNVFVCEQGNYRIRKITTAGVVTTFAGDGTGVLKDGTGTAAGFGVMGGMAIDSSGTMYVTERGNNCIRKITSAGVVTTLAGSGVAGYADGTGTAAMFNWPIGVTVDPSGNVYVTDNGGCTIRKITPAGVVTTLAGSNTVGFLNGQCLQSQFNWPRGIVMDARGCLYVGDGGSNRIRVITP